MAIADILSSVVSWLGNVSPLAAITVIVSEILRKLTHSKRGEEAIVMLILQVQRWFESIASWHARPRVFRAPGYRLERFLRFVVRKKTFDALLGQTIADCRQEYTEALQNGDRWDATLIRLSLYLNMLKVLLLGLAVGMAKKAVEIWKIGS